MSRNLDKSVTINGKSSTISKNKSDGKNWSIKNSNYDTVKIIDELLKNSNGEFKFLDGITICNPVTTIYLVSLNISRPSNHTGIIRAECGSNTLLTYNTSGNKKSYYGVIKSKVNIKKLLDLKERILNKIIRNHQEQKPTKTVHR